jgi:hypothetical protein
MRSFLRLVIAPLALLFLAGCSGTASVSGPFIGANDQAYVVTSDFSTGGLSVIDLDTRAVTPNVATVHSDATLRVHNGLIYVINRFGQDNIQIIDPNKNFRTLRQFSTGNGSNPQDIVFATALKAYITRYGSADLLVVHPTTGIQINTVSLAPFADGDGIPEMARMALVGPYLFVACQRLTNFMPSIFSVVVVIDTRTDAIIDVSPATPGVQPILLTGRNPVTDFIYEPATNSLLIGCAGSFGALDGGIERIDVATLRSQGFVITEATLGGDIGDIAWNGPDHSYAVVSDASFNASVVAWSTAGSLVGSGPVYAPGGFSVPDIEVNGRNELYVCDNNFSTPGVRVFRTGADTPLAGPLNTGLPPSQIAFR